ncbi:Nucleolar GTP-binding protein 1 [Linum perenne]
MKGASILFHSYRSFLLNSPPGLLLIQTIKYPGFCFCRNVQTISYQTVKGSYVPTTSQAVQPETVKPSLGIDTVGAFQKLPMVMPSVDILASAVRKAKRVQPTKGIANIAKRERNRGAKRLDALMKELAAPLKTYVDNFPKRKYLHPYERSLVELTLGDGVYEEVSFEKSGCFKEEGGSCGKRACFSLCSGWSLVLNIGYRTFTYSTQTKREAEERLKEGLEKLEDIFISDGKAVDDLLDIAKTLRAMPVVDLETPTLCLVGAPNVGKSSLVRTLSTGKPEVCNYPFTTRGILMGHIALKFQNFQVTDTPGLLKRSDDDRNNLEKLTLAVLSHLPTAVLYVHDLTGECGISPSNQFVIYKEIKERFRDHLWLDVVSKCDLLQGSPIFYITDDDDGDATHLEMESYRKVGPVGAIHVSVKTEEGLNELKLRVHDLLLAQRGNISNPEVKEETATRMFFP